ncbi:transcriptional antiterminator [Hahella sp. CCB-MM4]|uniref:Rho-binding antiterminator n=1 Tax=Hahella sp. (strain CCB-MM4) TaxID=1926491 RepID=UPI000B9A49A1|nr:Rho-binding antiterminator [Hahella sp. CCB-MM4]OZG70229.1 transcriptional antiterminator [Hahella sp. CCB-MM4]
MTSDYKPITCDRHDFLEIACLYHYDITIETIDEQRIRGQAVTTRTLADKTEWLVYKCDDSTRQIHLDRIKAITPLAPMARFQRQNIN